MNSYVYCLLENIMISNQTFWFEIIAWGFEIKGLSQIYHALSSFIEGIEEAALFLYEKGMCGVENW